MWQAFDTAVRSVSSVIPDSESACFIFWEIESVTVSTNDWVAEHRLSTPLWPNDSSSVTLILNKAERLSSASADSLVDGSS